MQSYNLLASSLSIQILMFSILVCKTKVLVVPTPTLKSSATKTEPSRIESLSFFSLLTNIPVGSQLLLGGSAVVTALIRAPQRLECSNSGWSRPTRFREHRGTDSTTLVNTTARARQNRPEAL